MPSVTLISKLPYIQEEKSIDTIVYTDKESLSELALDLSIPLSFRINVVELFYKQFGQEESNEIINRLSMMYQFSGTKILEKYLYDICTNCKIPPFLKITSAKSLCYFDPKNEIGYKALNIVCQNMKEVATPCKIDAVCLLMLHKKYKTQSRLYFCNIINNMELDCDYRYKTILSLENKDKIDKDYFLKESSFEFFYNKGNRTMYRILAGQYLLQKCKISDKDIESIESKVISFAKDPDLDYNLRADAADVILSLGSQYNKITAREIIMMLGRHDGVVKTIFDNAQNVHIDEIEKSVLEALEFLSGINMKTLSGVPGTPEITFEYVKKKIIEELEKSKPVEKSELKLYEDKEDKINVSLNRIYMDRALYSKYNCSIMHILLKIWTYLKSHESEHDMRTRLLEELIDMSGTCSSGFASRLINVISGFGDFNLTISWRDQIVANFTGRLNARARDLTDENKLQENCKLYNYPTEEEKDCKTLLENLQDFQGNVLEEMSLNCNDFSQRRTFLKFFRKNMLGIRQELYDEFKVHITDTDFDLYFRAAISTYETGGYV
jgi:hypothetical protein